MFKRKKIRHIQNQFLNKYFWFDFEDIYYFTEKLVYKIHGPLSSIDHVSNVVILLAVKEKKWKVWYIRNSLLSPQSTMYSAYGGRVGAAIYSVLYFIAIVISKLAVRSLFWTQMSNFNFFMWQSCTMCWPVVVNDWALDGSSLRPRPTCGQPWAWASQSPCPWSAPLWVSTPLVPLSLAVVSKLLGSRPRTWFLSFSARPWLFMVLLLLLCSPDKSNSSK